MILTLAFLLASILIVLGLCVAPGSTLETLVGVTAVYLALTLCGYTVRWIAVFYVAESLAFVLRLFWPQQVASSVPSTSAP